MKMTKRKWKKDGRKFDKRLDKEIRRMARNGEIKVVEVEG